MSILLKSLLTILALTSLPSMANKAIPIAIENDVYQDYLCFLDGRDVMSITDFSGKCSRRDVVEIVLIQQLLSLGGFNYPLSFEPGFYNLRSRKLLTSGILLANFDSVWLEEASEFESSVYISSPVIEKGKYYAGIYTLKANQTKYQNVTEEKIQAMHFTSSNFWVVDWKTLTSLGIANLHHEASWFAQLKMLEKGFAEAMLISFANNETLEYSVNGIELAPINNIKVLLNDSRHVLFSRKHPQGKQAFDAFEKGLKRVKEDKLIYNAYEQAGFYNQAVNNWTVLNP